ncbi:hypothetical protein GTA08_BOTSDO08608 [Botryosphaeria dothidea]|uniref:Uncharacterized protein n=1 Tax=Botryosphaeria dothidea TaxID=55169 RepID=A0A8H4ILK8_9PEZI|nr:hypothetical protein GTA08_BOTSDO08608 [Botryosphaeria dothidea]
MGPELPERSAAPPVLHYDQPGANNYARIYPAISKNTSTTSSACGSEAQIEHYEQVIEKNWGKKIFEFILSKHLPSPPSAKVYIALARLSNMTAGDKTRDAAMRMLMLVMRSHFRGNCASDGLVLTVQLVEDTIVKIERLLNSVLVFLFTAGTNTAVWPSELRALKSHDPIDWPFDLVLALADLARMAGMNMDHINRVWLQVRKHFHTRVAIFGHLAGFVNSDDVLNAIDVLQPTSTESRAPGTSESQERHGQYISSSVHLRNDVFGTQHGTAQNGTGEQIQPASTARTRNVAQAYDHKHLTAMIDQVYVNASNGAGAAFDKVSDVPTVMTKAVANLPRGHAADLRCSLINWRRLHSNANYSANQMAMVDLEKRFRVPFALIIYCPGLTPEWAFRAPRGLLPSLAGLAADLSLDDIEVFCMVLNQCFKLAVKKTRNLVQADVERMRHYIRDNSHNRFASAAPPLRLLLAPATRSRPVSTNTTPTAVSTQPRKSRRRQRSTSPTIFYEQPPAKMTRTSNPEHESRKSLSNSMAGMSDRSLATTSARTPSNGFPGWRSVEFSTCIGESENTAESAGQHRPRLVNAYHDERNQHAPTNGMDVGHKNKRQDSLTSLDDYRQNRPTDALDTTGSIAAYSPHDNNSSLPSAGRAQSHDLPAAPNEPSLSPPAAHYQHGSTPGSSTIYPSGAVHSHPPGPLPHTGTSEPPNPPQHAPQPQHRARHHASPALARCPAGPSTNNNSSQQRHPTNPHASRTQTTPGALDAASLPQQPALPQAHFHSSPHSPAPGRQTVPPTPAPAAPPARQATSEAAPESHVERCESPEPGIQPSSPSSSSASSSASAQQPQHHLALARLAATPTPADPQPVAQLSPSPAQQVQWHSAQIAAMNARVVQLAAADDDAERPIAQDSPSSSASASDSDFDSDSDSDDGALVRALEEERAGLRARVAELEARLRAEEREHDRMRGRWERAGRAVLSLRAHVGVLAAGLAAAGVEAPPWGEVGDEEGWVVDEPMPWENGGVFSGHFEGWGRGGKEEPEAEVGGEGGMSSGDADESQKWDHGIVISDDESEDSELSDNDEVGEDHKLEAECEGGFCGRRRVFGVMTVIGLQEL